MVRQRVFALAAVLCCLGVADAQQPASFPGTSHHLPVAGGQNLPFEPAAVRSQPSTRTPDTSAPQFIGRPTRRITPPPEADSQRPSRGSSLSTTVLALTLVIGVILVAARLWKKHGPIPAAGLPPEALELLGQRQIGSHHSIFLVRLGARVLVLGSATEGLRTLAEVNNPVDVDLLCGLCRGSARSDGVSHAFRSLFQKHLGPKPRTTSPRTGSTRQFPERQPEEVHA